MLYLRILLSSYNRSENKREEEYLCFIFIKNLFSFTASLSLELPNEHKLMLAGH